MAKMVEMTFAIGAALAGNFSGVFGKAGQALSNLQKQSSNLQKVSGQIDSYQKMQGAVTSNQAAMLAMRKSARELEGQILTSSQRTSELGSRYGEAQAKVQTLSGVLGQNKAAYSSSPAERSSVSARNP